MKKHLSIIGAHENNLKHINLEIEHDTYTVITGLSGSGKSSLAFDTVYAEGQRRYIETFSPYTRQFFDKVKKPEADAISGVRPAVAIQQRTRITNSRSTVGSLTNSNEYLKVLFANLAEPQCSGCGRTLIRWSVTKASKEIERAIRAAPDDLYLLGTVATSNEPAENFIKNLIERGVSRAVDHDSRKLVDVEAISSVPVELIFERLSATTLKKSRIREAVELAMELGKGRVVLSRLNEKTVERIFVLSSEFECECGWVVNVAKPRPALFSFNHPYGACSECKGFGNTLSVDLTKALGDPELSIDQGVISCWMGEKATWERKQLHRFCEKKGIDTGVPWKKLSHETQELILYRDAKDFTGVIPWFEWLEKKVYKMHVRVFLSRYRTQKTCPACNGARLKPDALLYRVNGKSLPDIWQTPLRNLENWLNEVQQNCDESAPRELVDALHGILQRVQSLNELGLPYLTLDRPARTLSGGETQRVNLATALGSDLTSTHFVLDEPSVGLHARDSEKLSRAMKGLARKGNSLLVVEHDRDVILGADNVIEIGPKAGKEGGAVVFSGAVASWNSSNLNFTSPEVSPSQKSSQKLRIKKATARNLKALSTTIPHERLTCIVGVSGSGKSTLVEEIILKGFALARKKEPTPFLEGIEAFDSVELVDQTALAKSPRANIATYTDIWDPIRTLLSETEAAIQRALSKSAFSFNVNAGRCLACSGAGFIREDMQFLSDVYVPCDACLGKRFQPVVLEVQYEGRSVDDILQMTVDESQEFFRNSPKIIEPLIILSRLGLGALTLGHPLSELSGGESQRLKLVPFLSKGAKGKNLFIFDEPTTGLHPKDVERLVRLFLVLRNEGHTVVCVEHNLDLIRCADWLIELGPEGGDEGGILLYEGEVAGLKNKNTPTAQYLFKTSATKPTLYSPGTYHHDALTIKGAREHNLKNIDISIPHNLVVTLTGASGSGKSTIAKDIIFAEGQRQYLECLSPYARQFIKELKRPEIDAIKNLKPTICVHQHTFQPSRLSTVGTMSEAYNFLRLLYAKVGTQTCPDHPDQEISQASPEAIAQEIKERYHHSVRILAPIIKLKKGYHREIFTRAVEAEISEVRVDGVFLSPRMVSYDLEKNKNHSIDFVVARCNPQSLDQDLMTAAVSQALTLSGGTVIVHDGATERIFSAERSCQVCKRGFLKPDPEDFSFSSKRGACKKCQGVGEDKTGKICKTCQGSRLSVIGRSVKLFNKTISELSQGTADEIQQLLTALSLPSRFQVIASPVLVELEARLKTLATVGLGYIGLNRSCSTLSGGELQRLRLASAMGSPLSGVMYIFDEPSIGLHPFDNRLVLQELRLLQQRGNSVVIIEHDPQTIAASDIVVDMGPSGGKNGGEIMFQGSVSEFLTSDAPTARAINSLESVPSQNHRKGKGPMLQVSNGTLNNITDLSVSIPLQALTVVAGVSGSGKSSLVHGIIGALLDTKGNEKKTQFVLPVGKLASDLPIEGVLLVDQKPIGANSRSTPASYLGIWDHIRNVFATTLESKARGLTASYFSYNSGKGRCPECKGLGFIRLEMSFLPDAVMECEVCEGRRYTEEAEQIRYRDRNIVETLNLTFEEAKEVFIHHRKIHKPLHYACDLGLGYMTLGQHANTVSGGESQRLKLVRELMGPERGHMVYLLDEPTTGLHRADIHRLMQFLQNFVGRGHTVLIIEHDDLVISSSDYVVELGNGAGALGGKVVFSGIPEKLKSSDSPWGKLLREMGSGAVIKPKRVRGV